MTDVGDRIDWWREARFGMFIHWGLYAVAAGEWQGKRIPVIGEWIMHVAKIPFADYAKLAQQFNPAAFDADRVARLARDAGMKYLVITAKHHDGFAMFKSGNPYNIVDATPYKHDPMQALAAACQKYGVRLCFYYSQDLDWEAPGGSMKWWEAGPKGEFVPVPAEQFAAYLEAKVKPQLRELLTRYGPVGLIWFDVPASISKEQAMDLRHFVHALQPDCLVSGRVGHDCGDYGSLGDNQIPAGPVTGDWETPATLNATWGFKHYDHNWKTVDYLVRLLVQCASKGVNYLLNIGPDAQGVVPAPSVERLEAVGQWLKANGESIYGTRQNPFPGDFPWGRVTCKEGHLYLHFFTWPGAGFALAGLRSKVLGARLLADGRQIVRVHQECDDATGYHLLRLELPATPPDPSVSVVALDLASEPDIDPLPVQQPDGGLVLPAYLAEIVGPDTAAVKVDRSGYVTGWDAPGTGLNWSFRLRRPGRYRVFVQSFMDRDGDLGIREREGRPRFGNHRMRVRIGTHEVEGLAGGKDMIMDESVNRWHTAESDLGELDIPVGGEQTLALALDQRDPDSQLGPTVCGLRLASAEHFARKHKEAEFRHHENKFVLRCQWH